MESPAELELEAQEELNEFLEWCAEQNFLDGTETTLGEKLAKVQEDIEDFEYDALKLVNVEPSRRRAFGEIAAALLELCDRPPQEEQEAIAIAEFLIQTFHLDRTTVLRALESVDPAAMLRKAVQTS